MYRKIWHILSSADELDTVKPGLPEVLQVPDGNVNGKPLKTSDFVNVQIIDPYCSERATIICKPGFFYSYDREGVLLRQRKIDRSIQKVVLAS